MLFSTVGGLRGGLALILVQTVVAAHGSTDDQRLKVTHCTMLSCFVFHIEAACANLRPSVLQVCDVPPMGCCLLRVMLRHGNENVGLSLQCVCVCCVQVVHAQMALWVSGVVLFTLTVNAPALGPLMVALGLNKTTPLQRKMHRYVEHLSYLRQINT